MIIPYLACLLIIIVICTYSFKYTLLQLKKDNCFEMNAIIPVFIFHLVLQIMLTSALLIVCMSTVSINRHKAEDVEQIRFPEPNSQLPKLDKPISSAADMQKFNSNPNHVDFEIIGNDK